MSDDADWTYDAKRREYTRSIGFCTISVWQAASGVWATSVDSPDSHNTVRRGFRSLEEAQAWGEAEAAALNAMAQEPPLKEREAGA
jgi:hypothetical protein